MTFPVGPINLLEFTATLQLQRRLRPGEAALRRGVELPRQLHVRQEHVGLAVVPIGGDGVRGRAGQLQPRERVGSGRLRHPAPVRRQRDLPAAVHASGPSGASVLARLGSWLARRLADRGDSPDAERLPVHDQRLRRHGQRGRAAEREPGAGERRPGRIAGPARRPAQRPTAGSTRPRSPRRRPIPSATRAGTRCTVPACRRRISRCSGISVWRGRRSSSSARKRSTSSTTRTRHA